MEDSLTVQEEHSLMAESVLTEAVSFLWIILSEAKYGHLYENCERAGVL